VLPPWKRLFKLLQTKTYVPTHSVAGAPARNPTMSDEKTTKGKTTDHDIAQLREAPVGVLEEGSLDPVYEAKARVLNAAIQEIGMGRYQWQVSSCIVNSYHIC
jgi:hypothetical protein